MGSIVRLAASILPVVTVSLEFHDNYALPELQSFLSFYMDFYCCIFENFAAYIAVVLMNSANAKINVSVDCTNAEALKNNNVSLTLTNLEEEIKELKAFFSTNLTSLGEIGSLKTT
ncbi:4345_t:CDS:2 [Dentiscutata erythropus]|uniref:4345_t:CDS:1 n=1 Tax=Dentiscutata erythropus TaxID=1348616 RepID=A0A9N9IZX3_9GLOM|nr:4345_t:CDS:2 [Dentiscutata erythropus]